MTAPTMAPQRSHDGDAAGNGKDYLGMKTLCANNRPARRARAAERTHRRIHKLAELIKTREREQDVALARLVAVLEHAHAEEVPHLTGRFRVGDRYSRLARLRAAHATYALATMTGVEHPTEGAYIRA